MFGPETIEGILREWKRMPGTKKNPPAREELQQLLMVAFSVSLKTEEDKPVRTRLTLLSREAASTGRVPSLNTIVPFDSSYPLTPEWLAKMASAFDPATTAIAVSRDETDSSQLQYVAWGIIHTSNRGKSMFADMSEWYPPPDGLTITVVAPGSLVLSSGDRMVGRFIADTFSLSMPTPFSVKALGEYFLDNIRQHPGYSQCENYWAYYRDLLILLLRESSNRSHGGTIVWVPSRAIGATQEFIDTRNGLITASGILGPITELCCLERSAPNHTFELITALQRKRRIVEHAEILAQLVCVDGALVVTDEMRPLSYGSMLRAKPWAGKVLTGPNGYDNCTEPVAMTRYGSRHNSAVAMAGACPEAVIFVISQDGPVRGLRKVHEDTVYWWPDCLTSVFLG